MRFASINQRRPRIVARRFREATNVFSICGRPESVGISGPCESRASVLDCGSPLPLFHLPRPTESARGLAQSKTSRQKLLRNEKANILQHHQLRRSVIFVETDRPANPTSPGGATCSRRCRSYGAWSLGFGVLLQRCRPSGADAADSLNRTMLKPRPANGRAEHCSARVGCYT